MIFSLVAFNAVAGQVETYSEKIPLYDKGAATFYVNGRVNEGEETEFMVDTGSGYSTINAQMFEALSGSGKATYIKSVIGVMADGSEISMPIYRISSLNIGGDCVIRDIEIAVLPGKTRPILGLSALKKAALFSFFFDPPALSLSNCEAKRTKI